MMIQLPHSKKAIVCPARRACSECELRIKAGIEDRHCQYWRGDSRGLYQVIGPDMDKKSRFIFRFTNF